VGDGDDDQGDEEPGPVGTVTSDATGGTRVKEQQHAGVPLRRVRAVEELGDFSLHPQGRPCGRPPAALRPGNDTTAMGEPASPAPRVPLTAWRTARQTRRQVTKQPAPGGFTLEDVGSGSISLVGPH
jgi:hypothetical protein